VVFLYIFCNCSIASSKIRQEAAKQNKEEYMSLWAGQAASLARIESAQLAPLHAELIRFVPMMLPVLPKVTYILPYFASLPLNYKIYTKRPLE
jgi:hypothetical protein